MPETKSEEIGGRGKTGSENWHQSESRGRKTFGRTLAQIDCFQISTDFLYVSVSGSDDDERLID